jgi:hypothetical protein
MDVQSVLCVQTDNCYLPDVIDPGTEFNVINEREAEYEIKFL